MSDVAAVKNLTLKMRTDDSAPWPAVREHLLSEGIDPSGALLANWFEQDVDVDELLVLVADGRVFELMLRHPPSPDSGGRQPDRSPDIFRWTQMTDVRAGRETSRELAAAFRILEDEEK